jgi:hypothetical protein
VKVPCSKTLFVYEPCFARSCSGVVTNAVTAVVMVVVGNSAAADAGKQNASSAAKAMKNLSGMSHLRFPVHRDSNRPQRAVGRRQMIYLTMQATTAE